MISQLHGTLLEVTMGACVIDVSGVGFELGISATTSASLPAAGGECRLYTRMQVREDAMTLFGFATKDERTMFDRLVAVSGVGPRLALAVLSTYSVSQLYSIVMAEDDKGMAKVPGVGKKTAQRLILELKSVLSKDRGFVPTDAPIPGQMEISPASSAAPLEDATAALLALGFTPQEAKLALDGFEDSGMHVDELVSAALRRLGRVA